MKRVGVNALEKQFMQSIRLRGPISVSTWMRDCLTHPVYGYYMATDVFGARGDFVTAPEVSPLFCQVVGSWVAHQWSAMGKPRNVKLVELGPGRGTLMASVLTSLRKADEAVLSSGMSVHMMEASPFLSNLQRQRIGDAGFKQLHWHASINAIPEEGPFIVIAHEYFDALPVFRFHYVEKRGVWCEEMVDVVDGGDDDDNGGGSPLRFVLSPEPTPATVVCLGGDIKTPPAPGTGPTREVSPDSQSVMEVLAHRFMANHPKEPSIALVIDYGSLATPGNTLRAIRAHEFVPLLQDCGNCDLSADVDFGALARVARKAGLHCSPLSSQQDFLEHNGIDVLLTKALRTVQTDAEAQNVIDAFERVVNQMGNAYSVMSFSNFKSLV